MSAVHLVCQAQWAFEGGKWGGERGGCERAGVPEGVARAAGVRPARADAPRPPRVRRDGVCVSATPVAVERPPVVKPPPALCPEITATPDGSSPSWCCIPASHILPPFSPEFLPCLLLPRLLSHHMFQVAGLFRYVFTAQQDEDRPPPFTLACFRPRAGLPSGAPGHEGK